MKILRRTLVRIFYIIPLCAFFFYSSAYAASFNCAKALTSVEKLICQNPSISALDTQLNQEFNRTIKHKDLRIIQNQKNWLKLTRNACKTSECLEATYIARVEYLKKTEKCPLQESLLLGDWDNVKNGDFEEMRFSKESGKNIFRSWLHDRPSIDGSWSISNCSLNIIIDSNDQMNFTFKAFKNKNIYLKNIRIMGDVIYKKNTIKAPQ
jgi:uncharacterized protein